MQPRVLVLLCLVFGLALVPRSVASGSSSAGEGGSGASHGTTYYVSPSGSDSSDGRSDTTPFRTIQHAADLTNPGDAVLIMPGTYTASYSAAGQPDVVAITRSGTSAAYITYKAATATRPVILNQASWNGIDVRGASYIRIEGLEIAGNSAHITMDTARSMGLDQPATNGGCVIVQPDSTGIIPHHVVIQNNVVHDCAGGGIASNKADYIVIAYNTVYNNALWSKYGNSGISIYESRMSDRLPGYHNIVLSNIAYGNKELLPAGPAITDGNGIIIDDLDNTQSNNVIYTGRTLVSNNLSYNNGGRGIHIFYSRNVDVINNTTFDNNSILPGKDNGELSAIFANSCVFFNNIAFAREQHGATYTYGNGPDVVFTYNLYFNGPVSAVGSGDLIANPLFVDPAKANFHLRSQSPAIDSGIGNVNTALAPSTDLAGAPRPHGKMYDRGAYEE